MGIGGVRIHAGVVHFVDHVCAVWHERLIHVTEVVAYYEGFQLHSEFVGEHAAFGEQFETDVGHMVFVPLAVDDEVVFVVGHNL